MSLIPSESYSFPDHFTNTVTPSRKPKEEKKAKVDAPPKKPKLVALPDPPPTLASMLTESQFFAEEQPMEPVQPAIEPLRPPPAPPIEPFRPRPAPPNPALLRVSAPPPRIPDAPVRKMPLPATLKPKVRWNNRAPAMDPAPVPQNSVESAPAAVAPRNIIPMQQKPAPARPPRPVPPAPAMREPVQTPPPAAKPVPVMPQQRPVQAKPAVQKPQTPATPISQADFFEVFAENNQEAAMRDRRQMKFRRFLVCEVAAVAVLVPLVILGLTLDITTPALRWLLNIFTIAAAILAAVIPILFYAFTPTLPELER